jgi:hypothetical protein
VSPRQLLGRLLDLPREAGTPAASAARALLTEHLSPLGWSVESQAFRFQPGVLLALPVLGAGLGWLMLLEVPLLMLDTVPGWAALGVWLTGLPVLGLLVWGLAGGVIIPGAETREDANLIATRGAGPVRRWLVAHVDTKAQRQSMAGRLVAVWVALLALLAVTILAVQRAGSGRALAAVPVAAAAGTMLTAGWLLGRGRLRGSSPGARDNGTGLLALLVAAAETRDSALGLLLTGAEEFGLAGARAFALRAELSGADIINLDTVTDRGRLVLVVHDGRGRELAARLQAALASLGLAPTVRRMPLGILADSLPFARRGLPALTVARLDWADLRRLHTPRDTMEELGLSTAESIGLALAGPR